MSAKHPNPLLPLKVSSHKFTLIVDFPSSVRCLVTDMDTFFVAVRDFVGEFRLFLLCRILGYVITNTTLTLKT